MTTPLLAGALGRGVEVAAQLSFARCEALLADHCSMTDTITTGTDGEFATYEILAVQLFDESTGRRIELRILASDGKRQLTAYFYASPLGSEIAT